MSTMEILTDGRGVEYVENATYADLQKLPAGWALCETCGRAWNDAKSTSVTPAPSARCPFEYEHGSDTPADIWAMLEQDAPNGLAAVQDLYSWSLNYDAGKGPFALFLDLIGWSDDNLGEPIYSLADAPSKLGYVELSKLADALSQYSSRPERAREYVDALMAAEAGE